MKLFSFITTFFLALMFIGNSYAHPIDVTITEIRAKDNKVEITTYLNYVQAYTILDIDPAEINFPVNISELQVHEDSFANYVSDRLKITTNNTECSIAESKVIIASVPDQLTQSLEIYKKLECPTNITNISVEDTLFIDVYETQKNQLSIYYDNSLLYQGTLRPEQTKAEATVDAKPVEPVFNFSFNFSNKIPQIDPKSGISILIGMLLIAFIGFAHTLEAGHSKFILSSIIIDKKSDYRQAFLYVLIFTLTHIADILVLGTILLLVSSFTDVISKAQQISQWALYGLFIVSFYMFYRNLTDFLRNRSAEAEHAHFYEKARSFKEQLALAFLTGLSPCLVGWSILLYIISTGSFWLIYPALLFFGLGIFVALLLWSFLFVKMKNSFVNRLSFVEVYMPLISSILLLGFSIFLLVTL